MLSPKRLVPALALLGYGALPAGTASCADFGPHFECAKNGQQCGAIAACCKGLRCTADPPDVGKCVSATSNMVSGDTAQNQR